MDVSSITRIVDQFAQEVVESVSIYQELQKTSVGDLQPLINTLTELSNKSHDSVGNLERLKELVESKASEAQFLWFYRVRLHDGPLYGDNVTSDSAMLKHAATIVPSGWTPIAPAPCVCNHEGTAESRSAMIDADKLRIDVLFRRHEQSIPRDLFFYLIRSLEMDLERMYAVCAKPDDVDAALSYHVIRINQAYEESAECLRLKIDVPESLTEIHRALAKYVTDAASANGVEVLKTLDVRIPFMKNYVKRIVELADGIEINPKEEDDKLEFGMLKMRAQMLDYRFPSTYDRSLNLDSLEQKLDDEFDDYGIAKKWAQ